MKKVFISILMCVAAMSVKAQVLTSETVNNVYEDVTNKTDGDFAYNAEWAGKEITTMYIYKKNNRKGNMTLTPHVKYEYSYTADGIMSSKVIYRWIEGQNKWICTARYDYLLDNGTYSTEYSRYNHANNCFDQPVDKMIYTLMSDDSVSYVSHYHRNQPMARFELVSETIVTDMPMLFVVK